MQEILFGEIFGVRIHLPILRQEVRALVEAKELQAKSLSIEKGVSLYDAYIELDQQINEFVYGLDESQSMNFYKFLMEESEQSLKNSLKSKFNSESSFSQPQLKASRRGSLHSYMNWSLFIASLSLLVLWLQYN